MSERRRWQYQSILGDPTRLPGYMPSIMQVEGRSLANNSGATLYMWNEIWEKFVATWKLYLHIFQPTCSSFDAA